jgi:hypothetical protein
MQIDQEYLKRRLAAVQEHEQRCWAELNATIGARRELEAMLVELDKPPEQQQEAVTEK